MRAEMEAARAVLLFPKVGQMDPVDTGGSPWHLPGISPKRRPGRRAWPSPWVSLLVCRWRPPLAFVVLSLWVFPAVDPLPFPLLFPFTFSPYFFPLFFPSLPLPFPLPFARRLLAGAKMVTMMIMMMIFLKKKRNSFSRMSCAFFSRRSSS